VIHYPSWNFLLPVREAEGLKALDACIAYMFDTRHDNDLQERYRNESTGE